MAKQQTRRLVIDGRQFLWRRTHRHPSGAESNRCEEVLRVFAEGNKRAVLQIVFRERPGRGVGYPTEGVVWSTADSRSYNLNRPAVITALIKFMLQSEWDPDGAGNAVDVSDGFALLSSSGAPEGDG